MKFLLHLSIIAGSILPLAGQERGDLRVMFYNVENLFDTYNDKFTNDDEFTPTGRMNWSMERYEKKLTSIFKVISGAGAWRPPEIIGLCEVENKKVLVDLITQTPLNKYPYQIVHHESPDLRGIDVAFLYRTDKLKLLKNEPIGIDFPKKYKNLKTRNILMASFLAGADTLYVFANHWPSRRSGELESEFFRIFVAQTLKTEINALLHSNPRAKIIILGDFNDEPQDKSLKEGLEALPVSQHSVNNKLYNLSYYYLNPRKIGTHKFRAKWEIFDQVIVSGNLLNASKGLFTRKENAAIYAPDFLLNPDERNLGYRLFQTYSGMRYQGGYSDHLPVYIDIFIVLSKEY